MLVPICMGANMAIQKSRETWTNGVSPGVTNTRNGERGTGNGEPGTGVWERVYSGNPYKNSKWRTKSRKSTVAHICHGKTYFSTAKLTFSRQNLLFHGKTYFSTAKLTFSRQNLLFHGKTYFSTAKVTFSRQNLLSRGKTYFRLQAQEVFVVLRSNMAEEEDFV